MPKQSTANHSQNMPLCGCPDIYPCLVSWPTSGYYVHSRKALGLGTRSGDEWWCGRAFTTTRRIHVKSISPDQKKTKKQKQETQTYINQLYIYFHNLILTHFVEHQPKTEVRIYGWCTRLYWQCFAPRVDNKHLYAPTWHQQNLCVEFPFIVESHLPNRGVNQQKKWRE